MIYFLGNTTTGNVARKILWEPEMRERLVQLAPEEFRDNFKQSLENDALILSKVLFKTNTSCPTSVSSSKKSH